MIRLPRKFILSVSLVVAVGFAVYLTSSHAKEFPTPEASATLRKSLMVATDVTVAEGLPHQLFEAAALETESKRKDTQLIGDYRFYTPAIAVKNEASLKGLLGAAETIHPFGGEKMCGGFHPDYSVQWKDEEGTLCYAHICFGCHEIKFSDGKKIYRYDLEQKAYNKLRTELSTYASKRPAPSR